MVHSTAILVAHHTIENLSRLSTLHVTGENMVDITLCVWTLYCHLTHVRNVENARVLSYCVVLVSNVRVLDWHNESAKRLHQGSESHVLVIETCLLFHI